MKIERHRLETGDKNVFAVYLPDTVKGTYPVLIRTSGFHCPRQPDTMDDPFINTCMDHGIITVTIDFFGVGETGGDFSEMTFDRWMRNLNDVFDWVAAQPWADAGMIGCAGESTGTVTNLRFAIEYPDKPALLMNTATAIGVLFNMPEGPGRKMVLNLDALIRGEKINVFEHKFGIEFFKDTLGHQPVYRLHEVKCPVLFMEGTADNLYRQADGWLGHQILLKNNIPTSYAVIEGGNHGLHNKREERDELMYAFMREHGMMRG